MPDTYKAFNGTEEVDVPTKYEFTVDWGDGSEPQYFSNCNGMNNLSDFSHVYETKSATTDDKDNYIVTIDCGIDGYFDALQSSSDDTANDIINTDPTGNNATRNREMSSIRTTLRKALVDNAVGIESPLRSVTAAFYRVDAINEVGTKLLYNCNTATRFGHLFDTTKNSITIIPPSFLKNCVEAVTVHHAFEGTKMVRIPPMLFANCEKLKDISHVFHKCHLVTTISPILFKNNPLIENISYAFTSCWGMNYVPKSLFDNNPKIKDCSFAFWCKNEETSIPVPYNGKMFIRSEVPDLWNSEKFPNITSSNGCYRNCDDVKNFSEIPSNFR